MPHSCCSLLSRWALVLPDNVRNLAEVQPAAAGRGAQPAITSRNRLGGYRHHPAVAMVRLAEVNLRTRRGAACGYYRAALDLDGDRGFAEADDVRKLLARIS